MSGGTVQEGDFRLGFGASADRLNGKGKRLPVGLKLVDFVVEEKERTLLVEIKDPSEPGIPPQHRARQRASFQERLLGNELIAHELVPKARDSYLFLHLMARDANPFVYVVLLGMRAFPSEDALLLGFKERLLRRLRQEADQPWKRRYVRDCLVLTERLWPKAFPKYALSRVSSTRHSGRDPRPPGNAGT